MLAPYRHLLTHPGVTYLLIVDLVAKLSTPVLSFALLLTAVERLGDYGPAGLVLTGHAVALAVFAPLAGRLADRLGPRATLIGYLAAHAVAYALLVLSLRAQAPAMIAAAVLLGATSPPTAAIIRSALPHLVPGGSLPTAYAVDNAINELAFIVGPPLVSALVLVFPAHGVLAAAGAVLLVGTALLLGSTAPRRTRVSENDRQEGSRLGRWAGPLTHRPTLALLTVAALGAFSFGCLRIATTASAGTFGSISSAGVLLGLFSAGAFVGTVGYGARTWPLTDRRVLITLSAAEAVVILSAAIAPAVILLAVLVTITGLVAGPRDAVVPAMLAEHTPARYRTEVFAWLSSFTWTGYGAGTAIAGQVTAPEGSGTAAFTAAAIASASVVLVAAIHRRTPATGMRRGVRP